MRFEATSRVISPKRRARRSQAVVSLMAMIGLLGTLLTATPAAAGVTASLAWNARDEQIKHTTGKEDGEGWSANTVEHRPGYLNFGPYTLARPVGDPSGSCLAANWILSIDNNSAAAETVLVVDVNDATIQKQVAYKEIRRTDFTATFPRTQIFNLIFPDSAVPPDHLLEMRAYWTGTAHMKLANVVLQRVTHDICDEQMAGENTRPQDGTNCEPAFVVTGFGSDASSAGMISAGHCDTPGHSVVAVYGDKDFEIIPLDMNRISAPTVLGGKELVSANYFRAGWRNGDTFTNTDRSNTARPAAIGPKGNAVCRFGGVSPTQCGNIVRNNYAPSYILGAHSFYLLDIACARGDSGSAVLSADGAHAVGIVSGRRVSDGACIVSRLERALPGLQLYEAPPLNSKYLLLWWKNGKWVTVSQYGTRESCLRLLNSGSPEASNMRCVPKAG